MFRIFGPKTEINIEKVVIHECYHENVQSRFRAFFSINKQSSKLLIMALTLIQGQTDVVSIEIYDSITGNLLDKAVASNQQYATDNAGVLAASPDTDATKEDITAAGPGTANLSGSVTADLSAYGLGNAVVINVPPTPVTVTPNVTVTPAARFAFAPPVTPTV